MKKRIKGIFTYNIGLKVLALVFGFLLWLVVVNVDDPQQTRTFTTVVNVVNEDYLTSQGKYYSVVGGGNTVNFRVTAKRSVIEKLQSSDFTAVADMSQIEDYEKVPVEITVNRYSSMVELGTKKLFLYVNVEDVMTKRLTISGRAEGTPAEGYMTDGVEVTPNVVNITGKVDAVSVITQAIAAVNVEGAIDNVSESVVPRFFNDEGVEMDITGLEISVSTVNVTARIINCKDVPVTIDTTGYEQAAGLASILAEPALIRIKGDAAVLNTVNAIEIPYLGLGLEDIENGGQLKLDITGYLPHGTSLADSSQAQVVFTVNLVQVQDPFSKVFGTPEETKKPTDKPEDTKTEDSKQDTDATTGETTTDDTALNNTHSTTSQDSSSDSKKNGQH